MAKKRREKTEGEEFDFKLPKFDEEKFLKKEKRNTKTLFISFILGLVAALVSFGFWVLLSGSDIRWYLILLLGIFCAPWLRYLFLNLNIDLTDFGRKGWFGTYTTYIFTWLIVLIILVNPPFYDEESPRIELTVLPGMQEPGGTIDIVAYVQDNVGIKNDGIEFSLIYPNGTSISPDFTFNNNIFEYTYGNPENILGQYNFSLTAVDVNGHRKMINSSFEYSSETLKIISSIFEGIRSGDVISIKADEKIYNNNFRVYYTINNGSEINIDRGDKDNKERYETSAEFEGWMENSNVTINLFAEVKHYFVNVEKNFTNVIKDDREYNFTTGSDANIGTEAPIEIDELSYALPAKRSLPSTPGFEILAFVLSMIVAVLIFKWGKKKKK